MQYYQAIGKPTPKVEVTNFLKGEEYIDAKDFAGDCEPVVMIAKGQSTSLVLHEASFCSFISSKIECIIFNLHLLECRCAGYVQVWNTSRLHNGVARLAL